MMKKESKFLEDLSLTIQDNRHIALLMDKAGWRLAKKLTAPSNLTLILFRLVHQNLIQWRRLGMDQNHFLSNQCYGVYEDIVTIACYACNQLTRDIDLVKSITRKDWINTPH